MRIPRICVVTFLPVLASLTFGCGDPTGSEPPGAIRVLVAASGEDIILDDLRVSIANGPVRPFASGSLDLVIPGLAPGLHMVQLEGMSANCQVTTANPRSATVVSDDTTRVDFNLVCAPRMGSVRVTTVTTGVEIDPDGYIAVVTRAVSLPVVALPVPVNGVTTLPNVREGQNTVTLEDVVSNCAIAGADTATVTVPFGGTVDVAFTLECVASGALEVTVSTTGVNLDPTGYIVDVRSTSANFTELLEVATNGSVTRSRLRPGADYRVILTSLTTNCDVAGADTLTVAIAAGVTTRVGFDVVCEALSLLAFVRANDIYAIQSDGSGVTPLTTDPAVDADPAWSSTGRIAFSTLRHNGDAELYVMNEDGTNPTRLTVSTGIDDAPSWSSDGQRIVFRSARDVNSEIYVISADGSGLTRLTNNTASDVQPAWSSTGKVAFVSDRDHPKGEIYVMNDDGSNVVRLTNNDSTEASPAWSPDGSRIAFAREIECNYYGCAHDIFMIDADGSNVTRLETGWSTYQDFTDPAWSPNGRAITFTTHYCDFYYCYEPSVWLLDLQGSGVHLVADNGANAVWRP
jgi:WD40 repeat protein